MKLFRRINWLEGSRLLRRRIASEECAVGGFNLLPYRYVRARCLRQYRRYSILSAALVSLIFIGVMQSRPAPAVLYDPLHPLIQEHRGVASHASASSHRPLNPSTLTPTPPPSANLTLRLIGILERGRTRAALVHSPAGSVLLRTGEKLNGEVVTRIDTASLFLSQGAGLIRTLSLREAS